MPQKTFVIICPFARVSLILVTSKKRRFVPQKTRRDGRVVDYTGLENRHTATYRGSNPSLSAFNLDYQGVVKQVPEKVPKSTFSGFFYPFLDFHHHTTTAKAIRRTKTARIGAKYPNFWLCCSFFWSFSVVSALFWLSSRLFSVVLACVSCFSLLFPLMVIRPEVMDFMPLFLSGGLRWLLPLGFSGTFFGYRVFCRRSLPCRCTPLW